jgi:hypothetical protein
MEDQQIADELLSLVTQLLEAAGPEWTLQFLQAGIEEAGAGGQPEAMSEGGMGAMPSRSAPAPMTNAFATKQ